MTFEDRLKMQLGALLYATLQAQAQVEQLQAERARLGALLKTAADAVPSPLPTPPEEPAP